MLEFAVSDLESLNENVRSLYVKNEADGKFYLDVKGAVSKDKLNEFRENNVGLMKEKEDLAKKLKEFDGVNMDEYKELLAKREELEGKKMMPRSEVEELIQERVKGMATEHADKVRSLEEGNVALRTQLSNALINSAVRQAALHFGVLDGGDVDLINRANSVFKLDEQSNTPIAKDSKGNVMYGKDGQTPMTVEEWVGKQKETEASHLFTKAVGSGSARSSRAAGHADPGKMSPLQKIQAGLQAGT